jgi:hypothetical protein
MKKKIISFITEITLIAFVFTLLFFYFYNLDRGFMLENNYFPWDSHGYYEVAKNFSLSKPMPVFENPFGERIIFPILFSQIAKILNLELIYGALILNEISSFLIIICFILLSRKLKISLFSRWFIIVIYLCFWNGPLRYSIYYPGGNYAFDTALISIISLTLLFLLKNKSLIVKILIFSIFFLAGMQRGIAIISIATAPIILTIFYNLITKKFSKKKNYLNINILFYISVVASIFGHLIVKAIIKTEGDYSMIKWIIKSTMFHGNIFEFLYTYYYAYGLFFFIIIIYSLSLKINVLKKIKINETSIYYLGLFLTSIFLSTVGGGDTDRFLLWFSLWYLGISGFCLDKIKKIYSKKIIILFIIISIFWTRPFIPALPPLGFSQTFSQNSFVQTNYDEKFFKGPDWLRKFKNKTEIIEIGNAEYPNVYLPKENFIKLHKITIPDGQYSSRFGHHYWTHAYKYYINNIPVPLGYLHNQRDMLIDHPWHGKYYIRFIYIIQWIFIQFLFFLYFRTRKIK